MGRSVNTIRVEDLRVGCISFYQFGDPPPPSINNGYMKCKSVFLRNNRCIVCIYDLTFDEGMLGKRGGDQFCAKL